MISIILILLLGLLESNQVNDSLELRRVEQDGYVELVLINRNSYPVTVELSANINNLRASRRLPVIDFIKGNKQKMVLRLDVIDRSDSYSYRTNYKWYLGNVFARPDKDHLYRLPFKKGESYRLDQGYNGSFSHTGDGRYALDFYMEEGTAIHAARGGLVIDTEDRFRTGGTDESFKTRANHITILHEDGTMADYSHLKFEGTVVKEGQTVRTGQLIGYSGATGYVTGPHLHFTVKKTKRGGGFSSIPVKFTTRGGVISVLEVGKMYIGY